MGLYGSYSKKDQFLFILFMSHRIPHKTGSTIPWSYRTISILNVDYKILMSIRASQMNSIATSYKYLDPSGFNQNSFLKDNHRRICNIIRLGGKTQMPALVFFHRCREGLRSGTMEAHRGSTRQDRLRCSGNVLGTIDIWGAASSDLSAR